MGMIHPKQFPFYPEHVPEELKAGQFWVCCDRDKVPLVASLGETCRASSTDSATWRHFDEAVAACGARPGRYAGVGRVITEEDPYIGVDFDDVRDPKARELSPTAMEALMELDSYTEVSPSGTGVKVWIKGDLERSHVKEGLEVYARGRYFTTTGEFLPQFSLEIRERTSEIRALVEREFPTVAPSEAGDREPYDGPQLALVEFFEASLVEVLEEVSDGMGAKFRIRCPWISEHTHAPETGTYVGQMENGALWFNCWHAHCARRGWTEFRQATRLRAKKLRLIKEGRYA